MMETVTHTITNMSSALKLSQFVKVLFSEIRKFKKFVSINHFNKRINTKSNQILFESTVQLVKRICQN